MKIEIRSTNEYPKKPNIWFDISPEGEAEKALLLALVSLKGKFSNFGDTVHINFYPEKSLL